MERKDLIRTSNLALLLFLASSNVVHSCVTTLYKVVLTIKSVD